VTLRLLILARDTRYLFSTVVFLIFVRSSLGSLVIERYSVHVCCSSEVALLRSQEEPNFSETL